MNDCPFCLLLEREPNAQRFGSVFAVRDDFPVTPLHWLVIPVRHCLDYFDLNAMEKRDADRAFSTLREDVLRRDHEVAGFNIGWNCGTAAGQTVMHAHGHFIPRRIGDADDPRGGVRGVIPARQHY